MAFDIQRIHGSKPQFRLGLAALPIREKLRLPDALREQQVTLGSGNVAGRTDGA